MSAERQADRFSVQRSDLHSRSGWITFPYPHHTVWNF